MACGRQGQCPRGKGAIRAGTVPHALAGTRQFKVERSATSDQLAANFISLIASEFITCPPIRLVA